MIRKFCCLIVLTLGTFAAQAAELVKDGQPMAEIVVPKNPMTPQIRYAAEELRDHIKKMSGAELPIVTEPSGKFKNLVHVGGMPVANLLRFGDFLDGRTRA